MQRSSELGKQMDKLREGDRYEEFSESIKVTFLNALSKGGKLLFRVSVSPDELWNAFLSNIIPEAQQYYNCNTCKNYFIERYGNLVIILEDGTMESAIWDETKTPEFFAKSVKAMKDIVLKERVVNQFFSHHMDLGVENCGDYDHLSVRLPYELIHSQVTKTVSDITAERIQDFNLISKTLAKYPKHAVDQIVRVFDSEVLFKSEICLGAAKWFQDLHQSVSNATDSKIKRNIIWLNVATAPAGFAHLKNNILGEMLESVIAGDSFETLQRKFKHMTKDETYRQTSGTTEGNILRAEEIIKAKKCDKSLIRRFAKNSELEKVWEPKPVEDTETTDQNGGVFGHLTPKKSSKQEIKEIELPPVNITLKKFIETELPKAISMHALVVSTPMMFAAIMTASHPDAPPIIQWDNEEKRNPFSWYLYSSGSYAEQWNIPDAPKFVNVTSVTYQPNLWYDGEAFNKGEGIIFVLEGVKDTLYKEGGNGLFSSILKSDFYEIRPTMDAFAKSAIPEGYDEASACGLYYKKGCDWGVRLKVKTAEGTSNFIIDRWD